MKNKLIWLFLGVITLLTTFSYVFVDQNFSYLHFLYQDFSAFKPQTTIIYGIFLIVLFTCYYFLIQQVKAQKIVLSDVKITILLSTVILLLAYPAMLSFDIFSYIAYAKILAVYHENPYIIMPYQFLGDPILGFTRYANLPTNYGFSWTILSVFPYILGFGNYLLILCNFKALAAIAYLGTAYVLWKLSKNIVIVSLFAFNPLVIMQILVSGHNDIVMMFLALLSFFWLQKKWYVFATIAIILSIGIKYVTIILLPIFLYILFRQLYKKTVSWETIYFYSALAMLFMFFISFLHREIYPWYVVWFLVFSFLVPQRKTLFYVTLVLSGTMLLTDFSYLYTGVYHARDQFITLALVFLPVAVSLLYVLRQFLKNKRST